MTSWLDQNLTRIPFFIVRLFFFEDNFDFFLIFQNFFLKFFENSEESGGEAGHKTQLGGTWFIVLRISGVVRWVKFPLNVGWFPSGVLDRWYVPKFFAEDHHMVFVF